MENKYMILPGRRSGPQALSVLRVYLGAWDGDPGSSCVGAAQCTALGGVGRGGTGKYQVTDLGVPWPRLCCLCLLWWRVRPRTGFHKAGACFRHGLLKAVSVASLRLSVCNGGWGSVHVR